MSKAATIRTIIIWAVLAGAAAWLIHFLFFTRMGLRLTHTNVKQLSIYLKSLGTFAIVFGMLAVFIQTLVPFVPFVLVAGANVLVFGLTKGFAVNYVMSCAGALFGFYIARNLAHDWAERRIGRSPVVKAFNRLMESNGFLYVVLGRLIPVIPSAAINLGAGVSKIRFRQFLFGTLVGKLPIVYLESTIAHDLLHLREYRGRLLVYLFIFIFLMALGHWIKKRLSGKTGK